jgi:enoyl-CoA hydratase
MSSVLLLSEPVEGVMLLTLNRPEARNAINLELVDALTDAFAEFRMSPKWRAGVLTGTAPAFCAGLDLKSFSSPNAPRHRVTEVVASIPSLGKPIIAAVNGAAFTGGLEIVLGSDFAIASSEARFADTHAKIGALSGSGMGSRLPRAVGAAWARQMMFTCVPIDAETALRIGLVNEVVEPGKLIGRALELASKIAVHDPELVRLAKQVVDCGSEATLAEAIEIEARTLAERKVKGAMQWTR